MVLWAIFFFIAFSIFVVFHQRYIVAFEFSKVENHAKVISGSLWTYEAQTPSDYLTLATEVNGYKRVVVEDDHGQIFIDIRGENVSKRDSFFYFLKLINVHQFKSAIIFEGRTIGLITVDWFSRAIYLYFYILFCMVLLLIGIGLYCKLLDAKRLLESRVKRRTADLEKEIQEHKRTESELEYQAQRLSMHVRNTPLGVVEWSLAFEITEWNKAAEVIFGYSREEVLGKTPFGFILPDAEEEHIRDIWRQLASQTGGVRSVNTNLTKSGRIKNCSWYNTTLTDDEGNIIGVGSLVLDITDQVQTERKNKILQQQLLQSQKMEAVGNLAGGIAHDFNNLLQSISGFTQLLLLDCNAKEEDCRKLKGIEQASQRAADLVRQLLTFSRKIESNLVPLSLNREIENIRTILDRTIPKMVAIKMDLEPDLYDIKGDHVQIEQILLNLGINANHAMPDGGTLTIATANVDLDSGFCTSHLGAQEGKNVLLQVSDTGFGMERATVDRIFEPFFTTKEVGKGTGLGLSSVYGIIVEHGAFIECSSVVGEGTVFRIYFPAIEEQPEIVTALEEKGQVNLPQGTETVLIVDDEKAILEIGAQMLLDSGYTPLTASSGEAGLQVYREHRKTIDIVVMDLNMPGMGGFKCMQALREINPEVCILVASGYTPAESIQKAKEIGADGFISKPFKLVDLSKIIRKTLDHG